MAGRVGRPEGYCHRQMIEAVRYLVDNGIKWRAMPAGLPPRPRGASTPGRRSTAQTPPAHRHARSAAGRAGHAGVDHRPGRRTQAADGGQGPLRAATRVWADGGYTGHLVDWSAAQLGVVLDIVRRIDGISGFQVLPRRWVVERSFAWCLRSWRLVRDYERRTDTSEAVIWWSMTMLMSRRLAAHRQQRRAPAAGEAA